jgi:hypothetical protein
MIHEGFYTWYTIPLLPERLVFPFEPGQRIVRSTHRLT